MGSLQTLRHTFGAGPIRSLDAEQWLLASFLTEERERAGHAIARQYLGKSGVDALIWGMVHHIGGQGALRLYWTTSRKAMRAQEPYLPDNFKLPILFWRDLVEVLRLVVTTHQATFVTQDGRLIQSGRFIADQLEPFIGSVRRLVNQSQGQQGWTPQNRTEVMSILAASLASFGNQTGKVQPLEEAETIYYKILQGQVWTPQHMPLSWARAQKGLGTVLAYLAKRETGTARLVAAVNAFREALKVETQERVPLDWAMTQHNLGSALTYLGERQKDVTPICEALEHGLMASDVYSAHASFYGTSAAEGSMKRSLMVLKTNFEPQIYEACLAKHQQKLKQIGLF
jgi:hypothetical protein